VKSEELYGPEEEAEADSQGYLSDGWDRDQQFPPDYHSQYPPDYHEQDHHGRDQHRGKRELPAPDDCRVMRARQAFQAKGARQVHHGHAGKGMTLPPTDDHPQDDESDDQSWGNWRDPHERAGPPGPGVFQAGPWTWGNANPYPQDQQVEDPNPGYRQSASGCWRRARVPHEPRRGRPRRRDQADDYDTQ